MIRVAATVAVALSVAGCVDTVKFSSLAPSADNIGRALTAEQALTHPATVAGRRPDDAGRLSVCLASGGHSIDLTQARIDDGKVCGVPYGPSATRLGSSGHVCYALDELQSVGLPHDAKTFGYYPVRGWLECRGET